ncbi:hypothetical protein A0H81_09574, partial [Grifola frondosa]
DINPEKEILAKLSTFTIFRKTAAAHTLTIKILATKVWKKTTPAGRPIVDREKTAPFLIRTFLKLGSFTVWTNSRKGLFPSQMNNRFLHDATLREVLTTLRITAPNTAEYRHPLARYSFRAVYADSASRGRFAQKELGIVLARYPRRAGTLGSAAPRLLEDQTTSRTSLPSASVRSARWMSCASCRGLSLRRGTPAEECHRGGGPGGEIAIKGSATGAPAPAAPAGRMDGRVGASGRRRVGGRLLPRLVRPVLDAAEALAWRLRSAPPPPHRRAGRGDFSARDRDVDRRVPLREEILRPQGEKVGATGTEWQGRQATAFEIKESA